MPVILYHTKTSPFSRAVLLLMRYLNIDVEVKILDMMGKREHMTEEFLKINPQHCVPTLDDNGFILWESRAILSYLMETRAPHLLPSSPKEKAIINQRLYHEMGTLMKKIGEILVSTNSIIDGKFNTHIFFTFSTYIFFKVPIFDGTSSEIPETKTTELYEILSMVDEFFFPNGNEWIAGENVSVADFSYCATISTAVVKTTNFHKTPSIY